MRGREEFVKIRVSVTESSGKGPLIVGNSKPTIQIGCEPKYKLSPLAIFWVRTIGAVCGDLLRNCGSVETHIGEMS